MAKRLKASVSKSDCVIPPPMEVSLMPDYQFGDLGYRAREIRSYVEWQARGEKVTFLEKVATEPLLGRSMDVWNVHTDGGERRWWVITNPTNLYAQRLFPSMDYMISFHVGVTTRMMSNTEANTEHSQRQRLLGPARRIEEASRSLALADEAEDFQTVGMRLREAMLEFIQLVSKPSMVPAGEEPPKHGDFIHWSEHTANTVARGPSADEVRKALKETAKCAWQFVNWLTHAKNAVRADGQIALDLVQSMIGVAWKAIERYEAGMPDRCPNCRSYRIQADYRPDLGIEPPYIRLCERCGWFEPRPRLKKVKGKERAGRTLKKKDRKGGTESAEPKTPAQTKSSTRHYKE